MKLEIQEAGKQKKELKIIANQIDEILRSTSFRSAEDYLTKRITCDLKLAKANKKILV